MLAWPGAARAQSEPEDKRKDLAAEPAEAARDERADQPRVDFDSAQTSKWWVIAPGFSVELRRESVLDDALPGLPPNLAEGTQATAGIATVERRYGPVTLYAGGGIGISTNRIGEPASLSDARRSQSPVGVGTFGASIALPGHWLIRAGVTATRTATGRVTTTVGVTAEKKF